MNHSPSDLMEAIAAERRTYYGVLGPNAEWFTVLYDPKFYPEHEYYLAKVPMPGAMLTRKPLGRHHRAGSIELQGLSLADAKARAARANAGHGLEMHRWS